MPGIMHIAFEELLQVCQINMVGVGRWVGNRSVESRRRKNMKK